MGVSPAMEAWRNAHVMSWIATAQRAPVLAPPDADGGFERSFDLDAPFGLGFKCLDDGHMVVGEVGGAAKAAGVRPGDYIVAIRGTPVHGFTHAQFTECVQLARVEMMDAGEEEGLVLSFARVSASSDGDVGDGGGSGGGAVNPMHVGKDTETPQAPVLAPPDADGGYERSFDPDAPFGLGFKCLENGHMLVGEVSGQANELGVLPGDYIKAVHGRSVYGFTRAQFTDLVGSWKKTSSQPIALTFSRGFTAQSM